MIRICLIWLYRGMVEIRSMVCCMAGYWYTVVPIILLCQSDVNLNLKTGEEAVLVVGEAGGAREAPARRTGPTHWMADDRLRPRCRRFRRSTAGGRRSAVGH
ncbi:hypothetical protein PT2222_320068 [Paraburkholderia tropica]